MMNYLEATTLSEMAAAVARKKQVRRRPQHSRNA
jgi:hypothetical protein